MADASGGGERRMTERQLTDALAPHLGADGVRRLRSLRRRLWLRRGVRSALLAGAVAPVGVAFVQLLARAVPMEPAPWIQGGVVGVGVMAVLFLVSYDHAGGGGPANRRGGVW